ATTYTVMVSGITRAGDRATLDTATASFAGRAAFGVASAVPTSNTVVTLTYDAVPDAAAAVAGNYDIPGLSVLTATVVGSVVSLGTASQLEQSYTVTVS